MYHKVGLPPAESTRRGLHVSPEALEMHLSFLRKLGYTFCDFDDLRRIHAGEISSPEKPVILTFDDGYTDNYTEGLPILKRHGAKATVFIIAGDAGKSGLFWEGAGEAAPSAIMTWDQARELRQAGISIQSHGMTHRHCGNTPADELIVEAGESRRIIEREIGVAPIAYAYQRGGLSEDYKRCVRDAGYLFACTTIEGVNELHSMDHFALKRIAVKGYRRFHGWKFKLKALVISPLRLKASKEL